MDAELPSEDRGVAVGIAVRGGVGGQAVKRDSARDVPGERGRED